MKKHIVVALLLVTCTALGAVMVNPVINVDRFTVQRVGIFGDDIAYSGTRAIYIIKDTKTDREYIGVSGIGISELESHRSGKQSIQDER